MRILGLEINKAPKAEAESNHVPYKRTYTPVYEGMFNGEKTPGELGAIYNLKEDREALRMRAYEQSLTNDVVGIITGKFFKWVIGTGLKLQSEPNKEVLKTERVNDELKDFSKIVEARFNVFASSKMADYAEMENLHEKARQAFKGAFFGDVLVVLRVKDGFPNVQIIDGEHVTTPFFNDENNWIKKAEKKGNIIRNGIEINEFGKHVAYYVSVRNAKNEFGKFERIEAEGSKTKRKMAWFISLKKHRINSDRGIPVITSILEKLAKLDRFSESAVASAEERAKIVLSIEHNQDSTGESPFKKNYASALGKNKDKAKETDSYELGAETALDVAATTSKQTFNMPVGSSLKSLYSQSEIHYEPFWRAIFNSICAAVEIPPEVALQMYSSNYSASRAAINAWGYIVETYRTLMSEKFYQPFYELWLETEILKGKISAPGYLKNSDNFMVRAAYCKSRFVGQNMPHIDPVKEVKAVILALENGLMSHEQASEVLNYGDWESNYKKLIEENKIKPKEPTNEQSNDKDKGEHRK